MTDYFDVASGDIISALTTQQLYTILNHNFIVSEPEITISNMDLTVTVNIFSLYETDMYEKVTQTVTIPSADATNPRIDLIAAKNDITFPTGLSATAASGGSLADGTYYYRISAIDSNGIESIASMNANATTDSGAGNSTVNLSWTASSDAASYNIYRTTTEGSYGASSLLASGVTTTTYSDDGSVTLSAGSPKSIYSFKMYVRKGTAEATPKPPILHNNEVLIAYVNVPAGTTAITNDNIHTSVWDLTELLFLNFRSIPTDYPSDAYSFRFNALNSSIIAPYNSSTYIDIGHTDYTNDPVYPDLVLNKKGRILSETNATTFKSNTNFMDVYYKNPIYPYTFDYSNTNEKIYASNTTGTDIFAELNNRNQVYNLDYILGSGMTASQQDKITVNVPTYFVNPAKTGDTDGYVTAWTISFPATYIKRMFVVEENGNGSYCTGKIQYHKVSDATWYDWDNAIIDTLTYRNILHVFPTATEIDGIRGLLDNSDTSNARSIEWKYLALFKE